MTFLSIASLLMGGFEGLNSAGAAGEAKKLSQQQQQQQAAEMKNAAQQKSNLQLQANQSADTAKAAAIKTQMGPANGGFGGMLLQPAGNALVPGISKGGRGLFGM